MARKRMIDPDFWSDEKLGNHSRDERLLFMGLISNSDDEGYGRANVKLLKAAIFPYDDDIKPKDIEKMLVNLKGLVYVYIIDGQEFYYLPNFLKHQVINKPTSSKLPKMPENIEDLQLPEYYGSTTGELPPNIKEENRKEKNMAIDEFFNSLWKLYPRKEGRGSISKSQKEKLYKEVGYNQFIRCIERYKEAKKKEDPKFLQYGSTFFNSGYVDYLDKAFGQGPEPQQPVPLQLKVIDYL